MFLEKFAARLFSVAAHTIGLAALIYRLRRLTRHSRASIRRALTS